MCLVGDRFSGKSKRPDFPAVGDINFAKIAKTASIKEFKPAEHKLDEDSFF